jgi:chemotaxis signal transduction protein
MEYLPFRIAGRDFVVDASRVRAIVTFDRFRDPSGQQSYAAPVIDLRQKLRLPPVFYGRRPSLVVTGFAADYVSDLIQGSERDCRRGKLHAGGRPKWVLDPDSLSIESR